VSPSFAMPFRDKELTNAYEKIMEQRRGADDKGSKVPWRHHWNHPKT